MPTYSTDDYSGATGIDSTRIKRHSERNCILWFKTESNYRRRSEAAVGNVLPVSTTAGGYGNTTIYLSKTEACSPLAKGTIMHIKKKAKLTVIRTTASVSFETNQQFMPYSRTLLAPFRSSSILY
jgi:hypothetical protein